MLISFICLLVSSLSLLRFLVPNSLFPYFRYASRTALDTHCSLPLYKIQVSVGVKMLYSGKLDNFFFHYSIHYSCSNVIFTLHTTPTLGGINECCLEDSPRPGTRYKAVRVSDHGENHGRSDFDFILNFLPGIPNVGNILFKYQKNKLFYYWHVTRVLVVIINISRLKIEMI